MMKLKIRLKFAAAALLVLCLFWLFSSRTRFFSSLSLISNEESGLTSNVHDLYSPKRLISLPVDYKVHIAVVACGKERCIESLNMIKSAIVFSQEHLKFTIVTENATMPLYREKLDDWQVQNNHSFIFELLPLTFPEQNRNEWKKLFKPCAAQRLFLPSLLKDVDSILYLDTDTLFLSPAEKTWSLFEKFNVSQVAAMSPEHESPQMGWYNRFARHPFYGALGINSGVMLMNLTRLRDLQWEETILAIYKEYKLQLVWGDQDLINILFNFHSEKLFVFDCSYNFRPDHCMYMSLCKPAASNGVKIVHGNRGYFHSESQPIFKNIYQTIEEYRFLTSVEENIIDKIEMNIAKSNCDKVMEDFLHIPRQISKKLDSKIAEFGNY